MVSVFFLPEQDREWCCYSVKKHRGRQSIHDSWTERGSQKETRGESLA
jgi:hypothetical protein